jgi:hypothetical protein
VPDQDVQDKPPVKKAFYEELGPGERSALISWLAFTLTFSSVRVLTWSIKNNKGPFHNITVGKGGPHLHHYLWGILMVSTVGGLSLRGVEKRRDHPLMATAYGSGLALIVDEFALLLDLEDVYWAKQGRYSIDLAIGLIGGAGSLFAGLPVLRRLVKSR